jgi:indole-3-glycerol phosphate synthase
VSGFLTEMAAASRARAEAARAAEPLATLRSRLRDAPPVRLLSRSGFDLLAEVKLRSPSEGALTSGESAIATVMSQARSYENGGAAALSVLTEPSRFAGHLDHLAAVAAEVRCPVMRKDFLVDPYQVIAARAAGASGVLLILRILPGDALRAMLDTASELGMFVLLEAFDAPELDRSAGFAASDVLIGLNCRDLQTLAVVPDRLEALAPRFPAGSIRVAESGLRHSADIERVARSGYDLALVGTALMGAADPARAVREMVASGRAAKEAACASA